jgi:hypothetical protein
LRHNVGLAVICQIKKSDCQIICHAAMRFQQIASATECGETSPQRQSWPYVSFSSFVQKPCAIFSGTKGIRSRGCFRTPSIIFSGTIATFPVATFLERPSEPGREDRREKHRHFFWHEALCLFLGLKRARERFCAILSSTISPFLMANDRIPHT